MNLRYVITGCAASGTGWTAAVMRHVGSPCGHEQVYTAEPEKMRNGLEGDCSWMAMPNAPDELPVLVIVRNPLSVVRSISQMSFLHDPDFWSTKFAYEHMPELEGKDWFTAALHYVANWDAEPPPNARTLRVEDINPDTLRTTVRYLTGRRASLRRCRFALKQTKSKTNSHRGQRSGVTWRDIRNHPDGVGVIEKAKTWGYQ